MRFSGGKTSFVICFANATFPQRGKLKDGLPKAFPFRGRWHGEAVTDEVRYPYKSPFA